MKTIFAILCISLLGLTQLEAQEMSGFKEALALGTVAPAFEGKDQENRLIKSDDLLKKGAIVLVFYRGTWCPYCKKHVSELQDNLQKITDLGASVVVVTPEQPEYIEKMASKTDATFSILYDEGYQIMKDYQVDFEINQQTVTSYYGYIENHTRTHNGNDEGILPIPATYIIKADGQIGFIHYDKDYKQRASIETIIEQLK